MTTAAVAYPAFRPECSLPYNGAIAIPNPALCWLDTDDVKPAASMIDQGTEGDNQAYFAPRFVGVARERKNVTDPAGTVDVMRVWQGVIPCESDTYNPGDLVTVVGGTTLDNWKVKKTGSENLAIGKVLKGYASATTQVEVSLESRVLPFVAGMPSDLHTEAASITTPNLIMDGATTENIISIPDNLADALSISEGSNAYITLTTTNSSEAIALKKNTTLAGTFIQTSDAAIAFAVGRQGATTPALAVKGDVSTCVTGLLVTARAAAAGVDLTVTSSGTNESLLISAKGTGDVRIGSDLTVKDSTTGNLIETVAAEDKIGFFGATPVVQPGGWTVSDYTAGKTFAGDSSDATVAVKAIASLVNDLVSLGLVDGTVTPAA